MRNDVFITRLARGTMAAGVAGAWMLPQKQAEVPLFPLPSQEVIGAAMLPPPEAKTETDGQTTVVLTFTETPSEWDKKLEKEFRALALAEAKGTLAANQGQRLDELTSLRNRLLNGMTAEEIAVQLKRDRLLARMESVIREYVEFQEATGQKRFAA